MNPVTQLAKGLFDLLPSESEALYRVCRKYVDRYNGDNNADMRTNGELVLMQQVLPAARVVFDVGANVGDWVREALLINTGAAYHCFEPSPTTYRTLVANTLPSSVTTNDFGLGDNETVASLLVFGDNAGTNSLYRREGIDIEQVREESIRLMTLDMYCAERGIARIDFVKLDVEGHEFAVLRGACRMLSEGRINAIQFEYGGTNIDARVFLKDIWDYVHSANKNYCFFKLFSEGPRAMPKYQQIFETFKYSNWVIRLD